jgi:hypothetical protein
MLNGACFFRTVKHGKLTIYMVSLYDINKAFEDKDLKEKSLDEVIPKQSHEFLLLFSKVLADRLPRH